MPLHVRKISKEGKVSICTKRANAINNFHNQEEFFKKSISYILDDSCSAVKFIRVELGRSESWSMCRSHQLFHQKRFILAYLSIRATSKK